MSEEHDHITLVLRECEETLRTLATQGRLQDGALSAFLNLASKVAQEMDRRKGADRRVEERGTPDRRTNEAVAMEVTDIVRT